MKSLKRILSFVLVLSLMLMLTPISLSAFAYPTNYPNTHTNCGDQILDIIAVAETQINYTYSSGTKYGEWFGLTKQPWCAMFLSWCANQAGIPTSIFPKESGSANLKNALISCGGVYHNRSGYTPKPGDVLYSSSGHTALVTACDGTTITVVQGNWGSKVAKTTYSINDTYMNSTAITGYVTPAYSYLVNSTSGDFDGDGQLEYIGMYGGNGPTMELVLWEDESSAFWKSRGTVVCQSDSYAAAGTEGRMVAGDFDGDGKDDIAAFYDYGNDVMRVWLFKRVDATTFSHYSVLYSGAYDVTKITGRIVAGDFDGDGKDEIGAFYDYGNNQTRLWKFKQVDRTTFSHCSVLYLSSYSAGHITDKVVAGDFDGDGKDEIGAFYDYVEGMKLWKFQQVDATTFSHYSVVGSDSFPVRNITGRIISGDFDGDGKDEIGAFYDYGSGKMRLWKFKQIDATTFSHYSVLYSSDYDVNCITNRIYKVTNSSTGKDEIRALFKYSAETYGLWRFYEINTTTFGHNRIW